MVWQVGSPLALLVMILILAIIGIGLGGLYWSLIARQARDGRVDWVATLGKMVVVWPRLIGVAAAIVGAALAIWLTAAVISLGFGSVLGIIGALVVMLALSLIVWLLFYVSFSLHGVVLYDQRVIRCDALQPVARRAYFWPTLGLLIALLVIEAGMGMVWRLAPNDSWLWVIAIGGNAFVVSGLSMATMVFYMARVPIPMSALVPHPTHSG